MSEVALPLSNTPSWRGAKLKHRDNFTTYKNIFKFKSWSSGL